MCGVHSGAHGDGALPLDPRGAGALVLAPGPAPPSPGAASQQHPPPTPASTARTSLPSGWDTPRWGPFEGRAGRKGDDHCLGPGSQLRALH